MAVSISSHAMSRLGTWRNPQGIEKEPEIINRTCHTTIEFNFEPRSKINYPKHILKVIATEVGLGVLATTAIIETIAYASLTFLSLCLFPVTDRPCKFFAHLLQSSAFTVIWSVADFLYYNLFYINILTQEKNARLFASYIQCSPPMSVDTYNCAH